jgi:hypothetical protein
MEFMRERDFHLVADAVVRSPPVDAVVRRGAYIINSADNTVNRFPSR